MNLEKTIEQIIMDNTTTKQKLQLHEITALILQAFNNHIEASKPEIPIEVRGNTQNKDNDKYWTKKTKWQKEIVDQYNNNLKDTQ